MLWNWNSTWNFNNDYDWEALKKEGTVTETIEEKDGYKTITRTFVSADGKTRLTSSENSGAGRGPTRSGTTACRRGSPSR